MLALAHRISDMGTKENATKGSNSGHFKAENILSAVEILQVRKSKQE
jgi:hypothetical protein